MASTSITLLLVCSLMMGMVVLGVVASDDTPLICEVRVSELSECLPAITGHPPSRPTKSCCKVMHKVNLPCLCGFKDKFVQYGVNPSDAMALPKKCGLKLPAEC